MTKSTAARRPPIVLSETDAERLSALALQREATAPGLAALLLSELERAAVRPDRRAPRDVVRMNARVEYLDAAHAAPRTVQLVYPEQADIAAGRISVFTPIGVGLLGLKAGQAILWPDRDGRERLLTVLRVEEPVPA